MLTTQIVDLTPDMARDLLDRNTPDNRKIRETMIRSYVRAMRNGEWRLTHQGIAISPDGVMLDGQHRCLAVVRSGVTVPMLLIRGVDQDAFQAMDRGGRRSLSDVTGIDRRITDGLAWAQRLVTGEPASPGQVLALAASPVGETLLDLVCETPRTARHFTSAPSKIAATVAALTSDRSHAFRAYEALVYLRYDEMTLAEQEVARLMARQRGVLGSFTIETFRIIARMYRAYDAATAHTHLRISEATADKIIEHMRATIRPHIATTEAAE